METLNEKRIGTNEAKIRKKNTSQQNVLIKIMKIHLFKFLLRKKMQKRKGNNEGTMNW